MRRKQSKQASKYRKKSKSPFPAKKPWKRKPKRPNPKKIRKLRVNTQKKEPKSKKKNLNLNSISKNSSAESSSISSSISSSHSSSSLKSSEATISNTYKTSQLTAQKENIPSTKRQKSTFLENPINSGVKENLEKFKMKFENKKLDERILSTVELINESISRSKITAKNFNIGGVSFEQKFENSRKKNLENFEKSRKNEVNNSKENSNFNFNTDEKNRMNSNLYQISDQFIASQNNEEKTDFQELSNLYLDKDLNGDNETNPQYHTMDFFYKKNSLPFSEKNQNLKILKTSNKLESNRLEFRKQSRGHGRRKSSQIFNSENSTKPGDTGTKFFFPKGQITKQSAAPSYNKTISSIKSITKSVKKNFYDMNKFRKRDFSKQKKKRFSEIVGKQNRKIDKIDILLKEEMSNVKRLRSNSKSLSRKKITTRQKKRRKTSKSTNKKKISSMNFKKFNSKQKLKKFSNTGYKEKLRVKSKSKSPLTRIKKIRVQPAFPDNPDIPLEIPDALNAFHIHFDKIDLSSIYIKPQFDWKFEEEKKNSFSETNSKIPSCTRKSTKRSISPNSMLRNTSRSRGRKRSSNSKKSSVIKKKGNSIKKFGLSDLAHGSVGLQKNAYISNSLSGSRTPSILKNKLKNNTKKLIPLIPLKASGKKSLATNDSEDLTNGFNNCLSFKSFGLNASSLKRLPKGDDNVAKSLIFGDEEDSPLANVSLYIFEKKRSKLASPIEELCTEENEESERYPSPLNLDFKEVFKLNKRRKSSCTKIGKNHVITIKKEEVSTRNKYTQAFKTLIQDRHCKKKKFEKIKKIEIDQSTGKMIRNFISQKVESSEEAKVVSEKSQKLDFNDIKNSGSNGLTDEESYHKELFNKKVEKYEKIDFLDKSLSERKSLNKREVKALKERMSSMTRRKTEGNNTEDFIAVNMKEDSDNEEDGEEKSSIIDFDEFYKNKFFEENKKFKSKKNNFAGKLKTPKTEEKKQMVIEKAPQNNINGVKRLPDMKLAKPDKARSDKTVSSINSDLLKKIDNQNFEKDQKKNPEFENFNPKNISNRNLLMKKSFNPMKIVCKETTTEDYNFTREDAVLETDTHQVEEIPIYDQSNDGSVAIRTRERIKSMENVEINFHQFQTKNEFRGSHGNNYCKNSYDMSCEDEFEGLHGVKDITVCAQNFEVNSSGVCNFDNELKESDDDDESFEEDCEEEHFMEEEKYFENFDDPCYQIQGNFLGIHPQVIPEEQESNYFSSIRETEKNEKNSSLKKVHDRDNFSNLIQSEKIAEFELITNSSKPTQKICLSSTRARGKLSKSKIKSFATEIAHSPDNINFTSKHDLNPEKFLQKNLEKNMKLDLAQPEYHIKAIPTEDMSISEAASTSQKSRKLQICQNQRFSLKRSKKKFKTVKEKTNVGSLKSTEIIGSQKLRKDRVDNQLKETNSSFMESFLENFSGSTKSQNDKNIKFMLNYLIVKDDQKKVRSDELKGVRDEGCVRDVNPFNKIIQKNFENSIMMIEEVRSSLEVDKSKSDLSFTSNNQIPVPVKKIPKNPIKRKKKKKLMLRSTKQLQEKKLKEILSKENPLEKLYKARTISKEASIDFNLSCDVSPINTYRQEQVAEENKLILSPLRSKSSPIKNDVNQNFERKMKKSENSENFQNSSENIDNSETFEKSEIGKTELGDQERLLTSIPFETKQTETEKDEEIYSMFGTDDKQSQTSEFTLVNATSKNFNMMSTLRSMDYPQYGKSPEIKIENSQNFEREKMKLSQNQNYKKSYIFGNSTSSKLQIREMKDENFLMKNSHFNQISAATTEGFQPTKTGFSPHSCYNIIQNQKRSTITRKYPKFSTSLFIHEKKNNAKIQNNSSFNKNYHNFSQGRRLNSRRTEYTVRRVAVTDEFQPLMKRKRQASSDFSRNNKNKNFGKLIARNQVGGLKNVKSGDFENGVNDLDREFEFGDRKGFSLRENSEENPLYFSYKKKFKSKKRKDGNISDNPIMKKFKLKKSKKDKKKKLKLSRHKDELSDSECMEDSSIRDVEKIKGIHVKKTPFENSIMKESYYLPKKEPTAKKKKKNKWKRSKSNKPQKTRRVEKREHKHFPEARKGKSNEIIPRIDLSKKYIRADCRKNLNQEPYLNQNHDYNGLRVNLNKSCFEKTPNPPPQGKSFFIEKHKKSIHMIPTTEVNEIIENISGLLLLQTQDTNCYGNLNLDRILSKMDSMKKKVLNALTSVYKENYENLLYLIDRSISDKSMRVLLRIYDEIERCMLKFKKMRENGTSEIRPFEYQKEIQQVLELRKMNNFSSGSDSREKIREKFMKLLNVKSDKNIEKLDYHLFKVINDKKHTIVNQIANIENKLNYLKTE